MRILVVNKYYFPRAGSETYILMLRDVLEKRGVETIPFAMRDERDENTPYRKYFVDPIDYYKTGLLYRAGAGLKVIYSIEARNKIARLLDETKPDIAHLHIFQHQLSPSILPEIHRRNIPIIYTVHDLKPVCPVYKLYRDGHICEECFGRRYYNCLLNRCTKGSLAGSLVNAIEAYLHSILRTYERCIDAYITPSAFYRGKMIDFGYDPNKITHLFNPIPRRIPERLINDRPGDYMLYYGRIAEEKGIGALIKAIARLGGSVPFRFAGDGPMRSHLEKAIRDGVIKNADYLGFVTGSALDELIAGARAVLLPSEWYENGPFSVIESMAMGRPVIGARTGGIPEHIEHDVTGLLHEPGDVDDLSLQIQRLWEAPDFALALGRQARKCALEKHDAEAHADRILSIYNRFLN